MTVKTITTAYNQYYAKDSEICLYPVEFVVRTFLGRYPNLTLDKSQYVGKRILDLGYGDGRNMPLLANLGFKVYGVEISSEINQMANKRLGHLGVSADLELGDNTNIPFDNAYFDYLLACHSCYYVKEGDSFADNLAEIARVLKQNAIFVCSLPFTDTYILKDAKILSDNHYQIQNDPYGLRKDTIFKAFSNKEEIAETFSEHFQDLRIGFCDDDFYGIHQKVWIVTCWKK